MRIVGPVKQLVNEANYHHVMLAGLRTPTLSWPQHGG